VQIVEGRRELIADAAVRVISSGGMRSLTHRAVDAEAGLPAGSTSYYAKTRRELLSVIVHRLADRTRGQVEAVTELPSDVAGAVALVAGSIAGMITNRRDDQLARFAMLLEVRDDTELHDLLGPQSPVRATLIEAATAVLTAIGVERPDQEAPDLVALIDGLLFDGLAGSGTADPRRTIENYLKGLLR